MGLSEIFVDKRKRICNWNVLSHRILARLRRRWSLLSVETSPHTHPTLAQFWKERGSILRVNVFNWSHQNRSFPFLFLQDLFNYICWHFNKVTCRQVDSSKDSQSSCTLLSLKIPICPNSNLQLIQALFSLNLPYEKANKNSQWQSDKGFLIIIVFEGHTYFGQLRSS